MNKGKLLARFIAVVSLFTLLNLNALAQDGKGGQAKHERITEHFITMVEFVIKIFYRH